MRTRLRRGTILLLVAAAAAACATTESLRRSRGEGVTRFYRAPFEEIWSAALAAVEANNLQLDRADDFDRFIAATHLYSGSANDPDQSVTAGAQQGERIGIFVDSVAPGIWGVEVVTRRRFAFDPDKLPWAKDIFYVIEQRLGDAQVEPPPGAVDGSGAADTAGAGGR